MEDGMAQELKQEVVGFTGVNGLVDRKGDMAFGKVPLQQQNMKEHGQVDFKMDMVPKLMLMEVRCRRYYTLIVKIRCAQCL